MDIDRGKIGTVPAATERDDEAYLDFVTGIRAFVPVVGKSTAARADQLLADYESRTGRKPDSVEEARAILYDLPVLQTQKRLIRTSQEMFWSGIIDTYKKREPELLAELDRADRSGPGTVEYDPAWRVPDAYRQEIHIQPGGYTENPLAGYIYHYGTKCFYQGTNDNDEIQRRQIMGIPEPAGGVRRTIDLGCSVGQSTTAMKERWPLAEVWGIDVGIPMIRYAHKRAVEMGLDVHFAQRLAEDTRFPDNHFDVAHAHIMFHEVPKDCQEAVVREVARIVRPGGYFAVLDFPTNLGNARTPLGMIMRWNDMVHNCEPYSSDFVQSDFHGLLRKYFSKLDVPSPDRDGGFRLPMLLATK